MSVNLAPAGTASGSVTGSPDITFATPAAAIDSNTATYYGFQESGIAAKTVTLTLLVDLGSIKDINQIVVSHIASASSFELPAFLENAWTLETSVDNINYSPYNSGFISVTSDSIPDIYEQDDTATLDVSARYVRLIAECEVQSAATLGVLYYRIKELEIYGTDLLDIGLRVKNLSIGAKIATVEEPLQIFVNGIVYGIPWQETSPVRIMAGNVERGLATIS